MIITLRDPYNGARKLINLDKFLYSYPAIDGGYDLIFEQTRMHMDYKEFERFEKAVEFAQMPEHARLTAVLGSIRPPDGCTCGASVGTGSAASRGRHSETCPARDA